MKLISLDEKNNWIGQARCEAYTNIHDSLKHVKERNPFILSKVLSFA